MLYCYSFLGSLDYIVQGARFEVLEELGCSPNELDSGLTIILSNVWPLLLPAISVLFYSREFSQIYCLARILLNLTYND